MTVRAIELIANGAPWCITEEMMDTIVAVAERSTNPEAVAAELGRPLDNTRTVTERDGVAIIPVAGPIFPKANLFTELSGATSIEILAQDFKKALDNPSIHSILLDVDSPGGNVVGINEFAGMVRAADKPVTAYVGGMAASAAYWIASAADQMVIDATAQVGNIGVVTRARLSNSQDTVEIVSSRAPDKRPDLKTDQGRAVIQAELDALEDVFLSTVAANREQTVDEIAAHRGRVLIGSQAVEAGFADSLGSFESVIAGLSGQSNQRGITMSGSKDTQAPEITQKFVAENHPAIAEAFRTEGAEAAKTDMDSQLQAARKEGAAAERDRIQAVQEQCIPGHEGLIETLKFDGETSGPEAAVQVLNAEKNARKITLDKIQDDSPKPVAQPADEPQCVAQDDSAPLEDRCKAKWDASADLRAEFGNSFEAYHAFEKADADGRVRVLGK